MTHIDGSGSHLLIFVNSKANGLRTGKGVGRKLPVARLHKAAVNQILGKASNAVAAHLRQCAIRIDVMHVRSALGTLGRTNKNHAIGADAEVTIAQ